MNYSGQMEIIHGNYSDKLGIIQANWELFRQTRNYSGKLGNIQTN
jgi:hypothetical protein